MENLAYTYKQTELIDEWHGFYMNPTKNHGMVATLDLSKIIYNEPKTFWWTYESLGKLLSIAERDKPYSNVYLSLNAFREVNGAMKRKASHLAQIRNIGIDLDCYKLGISPAECKEQLIALIAHAKLPNPNLLINSGNGVQLIYGIEGGAAPTNEIKWLVMYITRELNGQLIHLGADFQCCTLERVFRLPGTFNKKPNMPKKLVTAEVWNQKEWTLNELMEYVKPYKPVQKRSKLRTVTPLRGFKKGMRTLPQMNMARANDLLNLVRLRNGEIENR
ncbi:MAG TPA: AsnC family protein, partial [Solibacillus sp.]